MYFTLCKHLAIYFAYFPLSKVVKVHGGSAKISTLDCEETYDITVSQGNISSQNVIIDESYKECDWTFTGFHGSHVKMEFVKFDLPTAVGRGFCKEAFVRYGGYDYKGRRVIQEQICGSMLPQTFVSSKGNAWLSYTVTGLHQNKWVDDHSGETQKGFTVQFTIYQSQHFENQLIVGLTCGLVLPTACCVPLCLYVRKLKKRKMKELAETDRVKKLQKKEELRRMLVPMKRNKWQRMSLRRKVVLKSAKSSATSQPRKRRRLSGSESSCSKNLIYPSSGVPPPSITSDIYEDIAQYVDPEEVHPLSSDKQNDTRRKKCIKHKNTNLIKRMRSSADNHTYISLTDIPSNVACQGSASSCPWNVTSDKLHSSTPMPVKAISALAKHGIQAGPTDQYFTGETREMKKPSPVTGCVVAFVESETDTGTSSDGMRRGGQNPRTVTPQQHQFQQCTDDLASDENNNVKSPWLPKVIITKHGEEESSSQTCSLKSFSVNEKKQDKTKAAPAQDSSTLSDSYHLDSNKGKGIGQTKLTPSKKPKMRLRLGGPQQSKLRGQSMKKRPRPIKEEESTESYISTDPTDQSESDHSVQNVDWSFEDPRHLSLIKECLEETDRATSFETMIKSQENIRDVSRLRSSKVDNGSSNKTVRGMNTGTERPEKFTVVNSQSTKGLNTTQSSCGFDEQTKPEESPKAEVIENPLRKREYSSSWELTPGYFKDVPKFDFTQATKTGLPGIRPLKENKQEPLAAAKLPSVPSHSVKAAVNSKDYLVDNLSSDPREILEDLKGQLNVPSDASTVEGSPSKWSYQNIFMKNQGTDGSNRGALNAQHISPLSSDVNVSQSSNSKTQPKLPLDSISGFMNKVPRFDSPSHSENSVFGDNSSAKSHSKFVGDKTYSVPLPEHSRPDNFSHFLNLPVIRSQDNGRPSHIAPEVYIMKETAL